MSTIDSINSFEKGQNYRRDEIHNKLSGQRQYGISTPSKKNYIFLFTGSTGKQHGYSDGPTADGHFLYSGEGQSGDMKFVRGNLAILKHGEIGKKLYLFEQIGNGNVRYLGEMKYLSHEIKPVDSNGLRRDIILFTLAKVD